MVLHGKHIARGLAALWLAAALGAAALAASATVQSENDYTRLNFQFDSPAKLQVAGGGRDIILNFDRPVDQSAADLQAKLGPISNGVQQSADGKQIILNLKKNYRVRQFTSGNGVGVDIMASATPTKAELNEVAKPAPKVPAAKPAADADEKPVRVLTPTMPKPDAQPEQITIVTPRADVPPVKVITPETLMESAKPKKPEPEPEAPPASQVKVVKPLPEAKVIKVTPPSILTTKEEPAPALIPVAEVPPEPNVNPAEALGPVADPIITTKMPEEESLPAPKAEEKVAAPTQGTAAVAEPKEPAKEKPAVVTDPNAPFLVGVKSGKAGTELYFPWTERVAAAVFERGNEIWIAFNKKADANVALMRTVMPKAVIRTEQFGYKGATVLRLTTDGSLHAQVGQPKDSYGWTVTLAHDAGSAQLDTPVSGEMDDKEKAYMLLATYDVSDALRFFDPTIGDLLIVVPTFELGRGVVNTKTTAELAVLRAPQGIVVASLRDDLQTRRDRTGVIVTGDHPLAVSQNLPVLTTATAPVPGVSATSGVMIPYDQWYVPPEEFFDTLSMRLQDYAAAKEAGKPEALLSIVQLYMGQSMTDEAIGYLSLVKQSYPDFYVAQKLALLSAASNLLSGHVSEASAEINAPELTGLAEAELWREAISLVAIDPSNVDLSISEAAPPPEEEPKSPIPVRSNAVDAIDAPAAMTSPAEHEAIEEEEEEEESGELAEARAAADAAGHDADQAAAEIEATSDQPKEVIDAPVAENATAVTEGATLTTATAAVAPAAATPMKREFNYLDYNKAFIRYYPPRIRQKLAIMAADGYLQAGQPEKSIMTYETLNQDGILERVQPYAEYMLGTIAASKNKTKEALKIWDRMSRQQEDPYIRARARYAAIMLRLDRAQITTQEATDQIERLRMSWRGDGLEREMLTTLVKIYRDEKQYDNALRSMKYLLQSFPGEVDTLTLAGDMSELFEDLFLHGLADDMAPLKSLGLFYEFRELTPIGERGDQIIQKLADRLAAVDLLERATQLLEHQVRFRVSGETRSRVGARLSLLYLLNKEPKRALEILEITNFGNMPDDLARQRSQLTAQALAENNRPEEALSILTNDMSEEGGLLRLDILWGMQDWPNVINAAEDYLGRRPSLTEPLNTRETPVLLKLALAYAFEEDPTQLRYLRDYYMGLLADGPYKEIFDYLTNDTAPLDADDFQLVAKQISRTESFMDTFKTKIAQGRLSEVAKEPVATPAP